jgi:hypothetical protein
MKLAKKIAVSIAACLVTLSAASALAAPAQPVAKLVNIKGKVLIHNGTNFVEAVPGQAIPSGFKVVTTKASSVTIAFDQGCKKELKENKLVTIGSGKDCATALLDQKEYVGSAVGVDTAANADGFSAAQIGATVLIVGGVAALAASGGSGSDDDDDPCISACNN